MALGYEVSRLHAPQSQETARLRPPSDTYQAPRQNLYKKHLQRFLHKRKQLLILVHQGDFWQCAQ
jgi:hypothetical protein